MSKTHGVLWVAVITLVTIRLFYAVSPAQAATTFGVVA